MKHLGLIEGRRACIVLIDPQERLMAAVHRPERVIKNSNLLAKAAEVYSVPVIATTQYKKGLGPIVDDIKLPETGVHHVDKTEFNCFYNQEFQRVISQLPASMDTLILAGVETHICVFQTAVASVERGFNTWVAIDATSSRNKKNIKLARSLMNTNGIYCAPTETIIYQIIKKAGTPQFKALLEYLK
ncbi:MAG: isochorismatase family protein [Thermodesulfobacteria bacterium]|nr:isochorismatase family protein [Thermodesulfobacteriota bacterium]